MFSVIFALCLVTNAVFSSTMECISLNLSNIQCEMECFYYNDINLYYNFIEKEYMNVTDMIFGTNISSNDVNETLLNATLRWYSLSSYPHEYYPNIQPDSCLYSLGTYCNIQSAIWDIMHGCCIPSHCNNDDAIKVLKSNVPCFQIYNNSLQHVGGINDDHIICNRKEREFNVGSYVFIILIVAILLFIVISTIIKYNKDKNNNLLINSFCIQNNWNILMKTRESEYNFCDGIRVISAFWIVEYHLVGHCLDGNIINRVITSGLPYFAHSGDWINYFFPSLISDNIYTNNWSKFIPSTLTYNVMINLSSLLNFMWLSGFFGAYSMMKILRKWKMRRMNNYYHYIGQTLFLYLKKYFRLIIALMFVCLCNLYLFDEMAYSYSVESRNQKNNECKSVWQSVLFLYNNIYIQISDVDECVAGLWYICCDFQLYLYLPVVCFIFIDYNKMYGILSAALPIIIGLFIRLYYAIYYHYFEVPYEWGHDDTLHDKSVGDIYGMPYGWMMQYYMGTLTILIFTSGYCDKYTFNMSYYKYCSLQMLSLILISSYLFAPYSDYYNWPHTKWNWQTSSIYYYTAAPFLYCIGLSLFVFCLRFKSNEYYSISKAFLGCTIFQILSKLSYAIYLIHDGIMTIYTQNLDYPQHFGWINYLMMLIAFCMIISFIACLIWIIIENPFGAIIRKIWNKYTKKIYERNQINQSQLLLEEETLDVELEHFQTVNKSTYGYGAM